MNFQVERLKRLPQRPNETWQGGLVRLPAWVEDKDQKPYRPWMGAWVSLKTRVFHSTEPKPPQEKNLDLALDGLVKLACDQKLAGYRPGKLEVCDAALAEHLSVLLSEAGILVEKRNRLFTLDETIARMAEDFRGKPLPPDALDAKGVTIELMRAFADAASRFYRAKPWEHLTNEDVIEVESPSADAGLRYVSVLGNGRMVFGLGFYESVSQFEELVEPGGDPFLLPRGDKHWTVMFGPPSELTFGDADLWEDYGLPAASDDAYPMVMCFSADGKVRRPGPDVLAFMEGLLLALAETDETQLDAGRWTKVVDTFRGQKEFVLSLPFLLDTAGKELPDKIKVARRVQDMRWMEKFQHDVHRILEEHEFASTEEMQKFVNENIVGKDVPHRAPRTPLEEAQDLIYEAFEARGRKRVVLARKALEVCPDCADACVLLAEQCPDPGKAAELYAKGVAAGERVLGTKTFDEDAGHFWGMHSTRPYMRARFGLAQCLQDTGRLEEAAEHYRELLRLNPNDNQGVRHSLLSCLLEMNEDKQAEVLLKKNKIDSDTAVWRYAKALLTFRQKGNRALTRKHLDEALDVNDLVTDYLLGDKPLLGIPSGYSPGSEEEAVICADLLCRAWEKTPGALEWLESEVCPDDEESNDA